MSGRVWGTVEPTGQSAGGGTAIVGVTASNQLVVAGSPVTNIGTVSLALQTSTVTAGTYGDATHVGQFAVNAQGQITSASGLSITFPSSAHIVQNQGTAVGTVTVLNFIGAGVVAAAVGGTASISIAAGAAAGTAIVGLSGSSQFVVAGSPVTGTGTLTISLQTSSVTAGTYGSATTIPSVTVNAQGQVTAASENSFSAGGDPWVYLVVTTTISTTSAAAQNVTALSFIPAASTRYEFDCQLLTRTSDATVGVRPGWAWSTGLTDGVVQVQQPSSVSAYVFQNGNINAAVLAPVGGLPNTTQSWPGFIWGAFVAGSSATGTVRVQIASEVATSRTVFIYPGSFLRYRTY